LELSLWYQTLQLAADFYAIYAVGSTSVKLDVNEFQVCLMELDCAMGILP